MVLSALDPVELLTLVVALLGLIPVAIYYRPQAKLLTAGYALLVLNLACTNLEVLLLGDLLDLAEHGTLMGSGLVFFGAAYAQRKRLLAEREEER